MIYFLQSSTTSLIKIGTTVCLARRQKQLSQEHGPLALLGIIDGRFKDEDDLHWQFRDLWEKDEWFRPGPDLIDFIRTHGRTWNPSDDRRVDYLADQLQELREKAGLSQYELGRRSGITRECIRQIEAGTTNPIWRTVQLLALVLGIPTDALRDEGLALPAVGPPGKAGRPKKPRPIDPPPRRKRGRPRKTPAA